jgi:hypothetical protein
MRFIVVLCLLIISGCLYGQVGRHEEPVDTIPIGGDIQENKMTQMESQDDLRKLLIQLRDSVDMISPATRATDRKRQLDQMISGLERTERSPGLMKKGYEL